MPKGVVHHLHCDCNENYEFVVYLLTQLKKHALVYPGVYFNNDMTSWQYGTAEEAKAGNWITPEEARKRYSTEEEFDSVMMRITQFQSD